MPDLTQGAEPLPRLAVGRARPPAREWSSVESFYQAAKFAGVAGAEHIVAGIAASESPEEAARVGRRAQRASPELVRGDWDEIKVEVMRAALRAKFTAHAGPRELLLRTASEDHDGGPLALVEASPHDYFWGRGRDGSGSNMLGVLLMELRQELLLGTGTDPAARSLEGAV